MSVEKIQLGDKSVEIDPANLSFNESTLTNYLQKEAGYYDNFGAYLAIAERLLQIAELNYDHIYSEKFSEYKDQGGSDKLADAKSRSNHEVVAVRESIVDIKYKVKRLQQHLRAWDKNHDNAQSLGYMLQKQVDKLHGEIYHSRDFQEEMSEANSEKYKQKSQSYNKMMREQNEFGRLIRTVDEVVEGIDPEDL
jgi:hypothetical protein